MKFTGFCLLWLVVLAQQGHAETIRSYYNASRCNSYVPASPAELVQAKRLFRRALLQQRLDDEDYRDQWSVLGFDWLAVQAGSGRWWIAREKHNTSCRGQGFYAFNETQHNTALLQVPHRYRDRHTGQLAMRWTGAAIGPRAIAWNTVMRTVSDNDGQQSDLAHRWDSYFVALSMAYAEVFTDGRLLQLHGFAAAKRRTEAGRAAGIIVSAGHGWPGREARRVHACLDKAVQGQVLLYPQDINELGATTNVQGRVMRSLGHNGFVHVELSDAMRARMQADTALHDTVGHCLVNGGTL